MGRNGEMVELANLATFLMADGCEYLTGQTIAIDGAGHLGGSGNFSGLSKTRRRAMGSDLSRDSLRQRKR